MLHRLVLAVCAVVVLAACEKSAPSSPAPSPTPAPGNAAAKLKVVVVPKGTTHEFWRSVHAGAVKAARELDVEMTFRGPEREDDREKQVALMENLIGARVDAIVLAPLDENALVSPVRRAREAKIPVVIIDSGLKAEAGSDFVSFVATDNRKGGEMAGRKMAELVGGKGKVLLLRYAEGSASTTEREAGFLSAIGESKEVTVIDPKRYAGATRATAQESAENLLSAHPDIAGVFCPNESSTFGMMLALKSRGLAGKVKFVGFDASEGLVEGLRKGDIDALVVQSPLRMGYLGVKTAVEHLRGVKVETRVDTGVRVVARDQIDTPEAKEVLSPDLTPYLGEKK